jgi:hypothetical protein
MVGSGLKDVVARRLNSHTLSHVRGSDRPGRMSCRSAAPTQTRKSPAPFGTGLTRHRKNRGWWRRRESNPGPEEISAVVYVRILWIYIAVGSAHRQARFTAIDPWFRPYAESHS